MRFICDLSALKQQNGGRKRFTVFGVRTHTGNLSSLSTDIAELRANLCKLFFIM